MGKEDVLGSRRKYFKSLYDGDAEEEVPVNIWGLDSARKGYLFRERASLKD